MRTHLLCFATAVASFISVISAQASLSTLAVDASLYDANVSASITTNSAAAVWFEWGVTTNYGNMTTPITVAGVSNQTISNIITGLLPYTVYHCQAVASNASGAVFGGDVSFTTVPTFVQAGTNTGMQAAVMAADGLHFAATMNGTVYTSTNLAVTFLPTSGTGTVFAVSSNGSAILAANGAGILASTNYGLSWVSNSTPVTFSYFATSSDAKRIVASDGSTSVYMSTNFGVTWATNTVPMNVLCLASSANGNDLYAGAYYHLGYDIQTIYVYGSTNSGATWGTFWTYGGFIGFSGIACSANGTIIGVASEATFVSVNGGASFSQDYDGGDGDNSIACSGDGQTMIVAAEQFNVYTTPNAGTSFYQANTPTFLGNAKAMSSADGRTLALFNGSLYLSLPPPNQPFVLSSAAATSNGIPSFLLTGPAGYTCDIQASTNFISWTDIATVTNFGASTIFTDPNAPNYQYRFYRAIVP